MFFLNFGSLQSTRSYVDLVVVMDVNFDGDGDVNLAGER